MTENLPDLINKAHEIDNTEFRDIIRSGFLALCEFVPSLNTIFDEVLPNWKAKRLKSFGCNRSSAMQRATNLSV